MNTVKYPPISDLFENINKIPIEGQRYMINKKEQHNGIHKCHINCDSRSNFSANGYLAIDKQGALLSFEVIDRNDSDVRGFIGLSINIKQQESLQCV